MEKIFEMITLNHFLITIVLVILGLWLKRFNPPVKEQYQLVIIVLVGGILSHYMINSIIFGICISGLVFYKEILIEELKMIRESIIDFKKEDKE